MVLKRYVKAMIAGLVRAGERSTTIRKVVFDDRQRRGVKYSLCGGDPWFLVHGADSVISRDVFVRGGYDFEKCEAAVRITKSYYGDTAQFPSTMVDCGANIGSICIPAVNMGYFTKAFAIEPDPRHCKLLRANAILNNLESKLQIIEAAAYRSNDEILYLDRSSSNFGDQRILRKNEPSDREGNESGGTIEVKTQTLDVMLAGVDARDIFLFMDTQGAEAAILQGAKSLLTATPPIVLEFWPYGLKRFGGLAPLLEQLRPYDLAVDLRRPSEHMTLRALSSLWESVGQDGRYTDVLVLPRQLRN